MIRLIITAARRFRRGLLLLSVGLLLVGCASVPPDEGNGNGGGDGNGNGGGGDGGGNGGGGDGGGDGGGNGGGDLPFAAVNGTEIFAEGTSFDEGNGTYRRSGERFTADYTLTPIDAETSQAFIGNELVDVISGNLQGTGQLSYQSSSNDFTPDLECPTQNSAGEVTWDAEITGTYEYIPALASLRIQASATDVFSPDYVISFTNPECPEFDSQSTSSYVWTGPGKGVWGFVTIVLENGVYDAHLDNPMANDLGAEDYYDIHVTIAAGP